MIAVCQSNSFRDVVAATVQPECCPAVGGHLFLKAEAVGEEGSGGRNVLDVQRHGRRGDLHVASEFGLLPRRRVITSYIVRRTAYSVVREDVFVPTDGTSAVAR